MHRLSDVELQLVMHGLAATEILQLARCSRQLLHAADGAFAWRHAPSLQVTVDPLSPLPLPPSPLNRLTNWLRPRPLIPRLSRHVHFTVRWQPRALDKMGFEITRQLYNDDHLALTVDERQVEALLAACGRAGESLCELDASSFGCAVVSAAQWVRILAHPSLQPIRVVTLQRFGLVWQSVDLADLLPALARLPRLHTLQLQRHTDARVLFDRREEVQRPLFSQMFHELDIVQWTKRVAARFTPDPTPPRHWMTSQQAAATFASMRALHTLTFTRCVGVEDYLPCINRAPALRTLVISDRDMPPVWNSFLPPSVPIAILLRSAPELHCTVELRRDFETTPQQQEEFESNAQLQEVGARFTCRLIPPPQAPAAANLGGL